MNVKKFRKLPVEIEAVELNLENQVFLWKWLGENYLGDTGCPEDNYITMDIKTLEGKVAASHGDYIIKGVKGEFYPCKPEIFSMTYEAV